jgi:hypothetical protein
MDENSIKEIANMQAKIDRYEAFILSTWFMIITKVKVDCPMFVRTVYDRQMREIWKFIKEKNDIE